MLIDISPLYKQLKGVLHIGGHHGQECTSYVQSGIKNICVFEPVPAHYQIIKENFSNTNVKAFEVALGSERGTFEMNISDFVGNEAEKYKGMSSSLLKPKKHLDQYKHITFNETIDVEVYTLDEFSTENDINPEDYDFMNIDVQGYELEVLKGATKFIPHMKAIYTEVNRDEVYENCPMVEEIDQLLSEYGFRREHTSWAGETWGDALYVK